MEDIRLHDPFLVTRFAVRRNLITKQGWTWTQDYLGNFPIINHVYKVSRFMKQIKFGIEIPQTTKRAFETDTADGNNLWRESMQIEIDQLHAHETFIVLEEHQHVPYGYKRIPYHCIYNAKFDGRHKCNLVAGGHMTDPPTEDIFSGVVSMETVRICFTIAKLNGLDVCAGDIGKVYLYGKTKEKVYIIAGSEFGDKLLGKKLIIDQALYGLKSNSARSHEHLSGTLLSMGYKPSKADYDLWIKPVGDHYEYIARYVEDVIVFSKDIMLVIQELKKTYIMKGVGKPQYYLGGDVVGLGPEWEKEGISEAFSAETYIQNALPKLAKSCGLTEF